MAATIAKAQGRDSSRTKDVHRLGSESSSAEAATWRTFARAYVYKDGSGHVSVERDGLVTHRYDFPAEVVHAAARRVERGKQRGACPLCGSLLLA